jgi:hypothetical protein
MATYARVENPCHVKHSFTRRFLVIVVTGISLLAREPARAAENSDPLPPELDASIARGLSFLAKQQNADGSFESGGPKVAMTGLSVLAFLSAGSSQDIGKYGLTVRSALEFLLSQQDGDGYLGAGDRGMYMHAIATLALAEAYGVEPAADRRLRIHAALQKATAVILAAQKAPKSNPNFAGGWRYLRNSPDSDLSLSGWNTLALRAAQDAGIEVPKDATERAAAFVLHCYHEPEKGFGYQPDQSAQPGDTAIGVLCLYLLGASDSSAAQLDAAVRFMIDHPIDENAGFPYYGAYYVAQAAFQRGGEAWSKSGRATLERLIRQQEKDGGWPQSKNGQEPGRVYATAMAVQSLAVPYRLLPVYQR